MESRLDIPTHPMSLEENARKVLCMDVMTITVLRGPPLAPSGNHAFNRAAPIGYKDLISAIPERVGSEAQRGENEALPSTLISSLLMMYSVIRIT